jgi:outer membrane immunogenic protein
MNRATAALLASSALTVSATSGAMATPPTFNWSGFYVGGNVGFVSGRSSLADDASGTLPALGGATYNANGTGFIGGFQAGYNWQLTNVVLGVEGDLTFGSQTRSVSNILTRGNPAGVFNARLSTLGTIRGRLGWAFDRFLVYGTGGVAFASLKDDFSDPPLSITAAPKTNVTGWVAGGGVEYAVTGNWTVKAEYLHVGFANRTTSVTPFPPTPTYAFAFKDSFDIGRLGLNYKF